MEFPEEVLSNPVFPLLLLENPNLVEQIPDKTLESFLKVDVVPDSFIKWVVDRKRQDDLLLAITMNPKTSKEILDILINNQNITYEFFHTYKHVIDSAKLHINWSDEIDVDWDEAALTKMQNTFFCRISIDLAAYYVGLIPESLIIKLSRYILVNLASNRNTPIHILKQIGEHLFLESNDNTIDNCTLIALAQNPNTPLNLLEKLLGEVDTSSSQAIREKLIYNPSISLTILQDFYSSNIAIKTLDTSSERLQLLAKSKWLHVRRGVAYHPNTPTYVLSQLAEESDDILNIAIALNHNTSANIFNKIISNKLHSHKYLSIIEAIMCNRNASEKTLALILKHNEDYHLVKLIAYHPNVTENLLDKLVSTKSNAVITAVATSVKTPVSLLMRLAKMHNNSIRMAVASNPNTPKELQLELEACTNKAFSKKSIKNHRKQLIGAANLQIRADNIAKQNGLGFVFQEQNSKVFLRLAQQNHYSIKQEAIINLYQFIIVNNHVSTQFLEQAAKIPNPALEAGIIRHPNTSIEILKLFTKHRQANIRLLITKNPKTPINIIKIFLEDKDKLVRESALAVYLQSLSEEKDINFIEQLQIVQDINTMSDLLDKILSSKWLIIRERVALHPNTSIDTLIKLAEDKARDVQLAVAQNANTPDEILEKLAHRHKWNTDIHTVAVKNLISRRSKQASKFIGKYIKDCPFSLSRLFALLHPLAPTYLLIKNYRSSYWLERYAIAQNPSTPNYILEFLMQDANRIVRAAAKANIMKMR
ncbi:MAG: hypothetical protein KME29_23270 [Calothrix sp. FI2-JRJ7]|nr:hypothetical protein [Calothrix sp. FI2-JRJ7]